MPRTTSANVIGILGNNYDAANQPDLAPFIQTANVLTSRVVAMAAGNTSFSPGVGVVMGADELERIEAYLAAHFYARSDPLYRSRTTAGASGQFQTTGQDQGLASTDYGRDAMDLDYSGSLKKLNKLSRASGFWLGKPPSQQIPYDQRS